MAKGTFRRGLAISAAALLGSAAALAAPMVSEDGPSASAGGTGYCSDAGIEQAIFDVTGKHTGQAGTGAGLACNPYLYNKGRWSSQAELQNYVAEVFNRCGANTHGRYIVLGLLEATGIPPQAG